MATTGADTYDDLPSWIRPGARLTLLGSGYEFVTVKRITKTQIVTASDQNSYAEYRFNRVPHISGGRSEWVLRGSYFQILQRRDHPRVVSLRIDRIARNAAVQVAALRREYGRPAEGDERSQEERALELLDGIENAARVARRKIEDLLNPSTLASAQYAQDLEA